jgi:hypothetical protein
MLFLPGICLLAANQASRDRPSPRSVTTIGRTRRHDSSRIVRQTVHALEGLVMGVELADPAELDAAEAAVWAPSITRSARALSRFAHQIKEAFQ